ncbi:MAG: translation elongation factor Ts [Spirochaetes bacterium GWD1_27_9]|nr:MAG: translation elongation factor Ts [Spirochaetes bacterium GWB1_27_13]OHD22106.1 MAG: translation elongation factor Ts [Spirochaetes bacterium GWC1_27_15]OHD28951.1 MAG: translation elongation factor Ts [Spirochaetes bacterium GWD1_27_9]
MATISAAEVKKLKDLTNAGMMDCKKALEESDGDMDKALKLLKEKGLADAKKRGDRETKEGGVYIKADGSKVAMILLGCETDFVSGNDLFKAAKDKILDGVLSTGSEDANKYQDNVQDVISQTKENIELKKVRFIELKDNQYAATYIHGNNKIGVAVVFELGNSSLKTNGDFKDAAQNVALHIAACSPFYTSSNEVPAKEIDEQKEIFLKQMESDNKPANIKENIIKGKIAKHLAEICLLDQKYVKDDKVSIQKYIEDTAKKLGSDIKIVKFFRDMVGA